MVGEADGVDLLAVVFDVPDLPEPEPGVLNVVSKQIVFTHPSRDDLGYPTRIIHGPNGEAIACAGIAVRKT